MKNLLLIPLLLMFSAFISGCDTLGELFQDDIDQIEDCTDAALDTAEAQFTLCSLEGKESSVCLVEAKDIAKASFESCLKL